MTVVTSVESRLQCRSSLDWKIFSKSRRFTQIIDSLYSSAQRPVRSTTVLRWIRGINRPYVIMKCAKMGKTGRNFKNYQNINNVYAFLMQHKLSTLKMEKRIKVLIILAYEIDLMIAIWLKICRNPHPCWRCYDRFSAMWI